MKKMPPKKYHLIRHGMILAAVIFWFGGCDAVSRTAPQPGSLSKGVTKMTSAQSAALAAGPTPAVDEAEPVRLETATFATG